MILWEIHAKSHDGLREYKVLAVGRSDINKVKLVCRATGIKPEELGLKFAYTVKPVSEVDGYPVKLVKKRRD